MWQGQLYAVPPLFIVSSSTNQPGSGPLVTLGWNPSSDPKATGNYLCWGLAKGLDTNRLDVATATNATVGGFSTNTDYYFTVVAYDGLGDQAAPSNEIEYTAPTNSGGSGLVLSLPLTDQTVASGSNVTFQVGVSGTGPLSYQWLFNGTNLPGATVNPLILASVSVSQSGNYQVFVSDTLGKATNSSASLTVLVPPSIVVNPTNQSVPLGLDVMLQAEATGSSPLSFQWSLNGANLSGATSNPLVLANVSLTQAGSYQVLVSNQVGSATSAAAILTVLVPPNITSDLTNQTVVAGSNVAFQVGVSGTAPLSYQWLFNGTNLLGATVNPLVLTNLNSAQAGTYQIIVSNLSGSVASSVAVLNVVEQGLLRMSINGNLFRLTLGASPGAIYTIQSTTNLNASWQLLDTVTADSAGILRYDVARGDPSRFYRVGFP